MSRTLRTRMALFQYGNRQNKYQRAHGRHGPEETLPREFQHDQITHDRCQHRNDAGDAVQHREDFGAPLGT